MAVIAMSLLFAMLIGGGISLVAQTALPGEPLWNFKIMVNEGLQDALVQEPKAQALFDISSIEARLQETEVLSSYGTLTDRAKEKSVENIATHAQSVEAQIVALSASGDYLAAADVAARFQAVLVKHSSGEIDVSALLDKASSLSAETSAQAKQQ